MVAFFMMAYLVQNNLAWEHDTNGKAGGPPKQDSNFNKL